jgi:heat shock protein HslJ
MAGSILRRRSLHLAVAATLLLGFGAAACGDDDDDASGSGGGAPTAEDLEANTWSILEVDTEGSLEPVVDGTSPTLTFVDDGTVALETGCNNASTSWELAGEELTFGMIAQTMMACADPPGVDVQEAALTTALDSTTTAELDGDTLTLLDDAGQTMIVAESAS